MWRFHLQLIELIGVIVPRRLRADWREEWRAELQHREMLLADWANLNWLTKCELLRQSIGAFWDALWLQTYRWEGEMIQDLRYGVRLLRKNKAVSIIAIVSLALGIGANTAIFSFVDRLLVRTLPVPEPSQLVNLSVATRRDPMPNFTYPDFADYREQNDVFAGLSAYAETAMNLVAREQTERINVHQVSADFFSTLRLPFAIGRGFLLEEGEPSGNQKVTVLSYGLWRRRFAADPGVVGREVILNGQEYTIVGIAPAEFTGIIRGSAPDLYVPLKPSPGRNYYGHLLIGRLKPSVSRARAQASMTTLGGQIARLYPNPDGQPRSEPVFIIEDGSQGNVSLLRGLSFPLKLLMGIVGLVLLIACANVAGLLLARADARRREIAIRLAIGAGRGRLMRQLLTESLLLALLGGGAGLALAGPISNLLASFTPPSYAAPQALTGGLDLRVLIFTFGLSLLSGVIFGLAPALNASRPDLVMALKGEAGIGTALRRFNPRKLLVIAQVTLSFLVLIGAGLCVRSLQKLQAIDAGFDPAQVLILSLDLGPGGYDEARGLLFYRQLVERVSSLPGIESASLANLSPLGDNLLMRRTEIEGYTPQSSEDIRFNYTVVGPRHFETMRTPFVRGRDFSAQDVAGAPQVVIINESMARRYWPNGDALGKRLVFGNYPGSPIPLQRLEIVGVIKDSKYLSLTEATRSMMFVPLEQSYRREMRLHIRTTREPAGLLASIRREVQTLDPNLPVYNIRTLEEQKDRSLYTARLTATLLSIFGGLALLLASIGLYGVMAYVVGQRRREIGIRLALGATSREVFKLVVKEGMTLVAIGLALGLAGAFAGARLLANFLYGVEPIDAATFIGIGALLMLVTLLANYAPARRASRVAPMEALRNE
jgi:predicted permease